MRRHVRVMVRAAADTDRCEIARIVAPAPALRPEVMHLQAVAPVTVEPAMTVTTQHGIAYARAQRRRSATTRELASIVVDQHRLDPCRRSELLDHAVG